MSDERKILCLMGPTASGKTKLAMELVQALPLEIISVDSAMVYRGMDIGTAKPSAEELKLAPHHLLDIRDPKDAYSAAMFCADARRLMQDIWSRGRTPFLVGGTMMYFRALFFGLSDLPGRDEEVRAQLDAEAELHGWPHLHARLQTLDPVAAARIHPHDSQRVQRALEVHAVSGVSMSEHFAADLLTQDLLPQTTFLAITPEDRAVLHARIALRFQEMMQQEFLQEVEALYARGDLHIDMPAVRSVGYRQLWMHLTGEYSQEEAIEKAIIATRQLAKRQLTWLRHWKAPVKWLDSLDPRLFDIVCKHLQE